MESIQMYEVECLVFNLKEETKVTIEAQVQFRYTRKIAVFDFLTGYGWYYTIEGEQKEVKRFSTIMNYLFKVNPKLWYSDKEIKEAKKNAKRIKKENSKFENNEKKKISDEKAVDFIKKIQSNKIGYKVTCLINDKSNEELEAMVNNDFSNSSTVIRNLVYDTILEYKSQLHDEHYVRERKRMHIKDYNLYLTLCN